MISERTGETRSEQREATTSDDKAPWASLEVTAPIDRDYASVVSLVECALVELTHEDVGAVFVSRQIGSTTRTQYVAIDETGERFQKRYVDDRLGWYETTIPRRTVRDELITQLRLSSFPMAEHPREAPGCEPDTFAVKPVRDLHTP
ncbi:hypothetical protein [Halococcoides cellulosivorans]|uniref:DUF8030 domain-containing protein n=1 Tax=Halococcoides cellulosivorans TaxID=1679096 RepID=A0A2R4X3Q9_9EURY|nr:hypothetical protein [Halococcoides cellulosivorans]AWB28427.1 hypothetical protein HARCEL1_12315 [Halococcoides cellulosivorans]